MVVSIIICTYIHILHKFMGVNIIFTRILSIKYKFKIAHLEV